MVDLVVTGPHMKQFGKAMQCISKLGSDLFLEAFRDRLVLRTVNSSRSANQVIKEGAELKIQRYACYVFKESFFHTYNAPGLPWAPDPVAGTQAGSSRSQSQSQSQQPTESEEPLRCKASSKSCSSVFRSLASIDKTVEQCLLTLDEVESRKSPNHCFVCQNAPILLGSSAAMLVLVRPHPTCLIFKLKCKHGISKTYQLHFEESESLEAVYDREEIPNNFTVPVRLLADIMSNFQNGTEEITFVAQPDSLAIENYIEKGPDVDSSNFLRTKIDMRAAEFSTFSVTGNVSVTFCMKELRVAAAFCDFISQPLKAYFEQPGKPIIFSVGGSGYESDFVLATLDPLTSGDGDSDEEGNGDGEPANASGIGGGSARTGGGSSRRRASASARGAAAPSSTPQSQTRASPGKTPATNTGRDSIGEYTPATAASGHTNRFEDSPSQDEFDLMADAVDAAEASYSQELSQKQSELQPSDDLAASAPSRPAKARRLSDSSSASPGQSASRDTAAAAAAAAANDAIREEDEDGEGTSSNRFSASESQGLTNPTMPSIAASSGPRSSNPNASQDLGAQTNAAASTNTGQWLGRGTIATPAAGSSSLVGQTMDVDDADDDSDDDVVAASPPRRKMYKSIFVSGLNTVFGAAGAAAADNEGTDNGDGGVGDSDTETQ